MAAYVKALSVKFFIALAVTAVLVHVTGIGFTGGLSVALVLTLVTFLAADIPFLLLDYRLALVADVILAIPVFWGMARLFTGQYLPAATLAVLALIVAAGEWLFHLYALRTRVYTRVKNH
ncbi:MAG: DUF2512 family protein [Pelotomaculum sp.]|uniref:Hypothetical membrane protein n=1 Tax=Pelotomaculum thermopropionicum (strain DSM 13744 / JCM 10971 / SI) TaxID=370438 RepID=A5D4S2_PELTS|nr:DUF2512 family protein [Pelotomaculum sp.]BAF58745.1 hypothetical membrane protein [Pelotomaculum thermopropionicum SI]